MAVALLTQPPRPELDELEDVPEPDLTLDDLEEGLLAIGDREDLAGPEARARLGRVRRALEAGVARRLAE